MDVERQVGQFANGFDYRHAVGHVRDKIAIHYVQMKSLYACLFQLTNLTRDETEDIFEKIIEKKIIRVR